MSVVHMTQKTINKNTLSWSWSVLITTLSWMIKSILRPYHGEKSPLKIIERFYIKMRVDRGKLSQWLYWEKNLLERSTVHILDVSVSANFFCDQCSVMASAVLIRDRVLHYLSRQVKFYSLSFHVIDIKRLFQSNKLLYYLERCPFTEYVG